jgi:hypothetical protein
VHLEAALGITGEIKDTVTGYLIERALDSFQGGRPAQRL